MAQRPRGGLQPFHVQVIAGVLLAANGLYAGVGMVLVRMHVVPAGGAGPIDPAVSTILIVMFVGGGLAAGLMSFVVRKLIVRRWGAGGGTLIERLRAVVIAMALAESGGPLGFAYAFLTGQLTLPCVLWGCSLAACILHFPTRAWLEAGNVPNSEERNAHD